MSAPNPMVSPGPALQTVSKTTLPIAGLFVDIYGLTELPPAATSISCLWLHHPRLRTKGDMATIASLSLSAWHARAAPSSSPRGLIAVAFDQRNHGTRQIDEVGNESWKKGNRTHAQDMFGTVSGMVVDTSHLMDLLEGYLFGNGDGPGESATGVEARRIDQHLALGVSLGGHSVWQMMFAEPRICAGVVVIGCPDYMFLLSNRARLSKLETYSMADSGASFLGSKDFPVALVEVCKKHDPKGILFGTSDISLELSQAEQQKLADKLDLRIRGKKFQVLSGGADKLVPYAMSEPFLTFFKAAADTWYKKGGISIEDNVYNGVGHEFNSDMMVDAVRFIIDTVSQNDAGQTASAKI